uniref:Uncharacterized protein n=1 Tax=Arundo donax TaxID=35708 RepID=A0A0A9CBM6_ARUDO
MQDRCWWGKREIRGNCNVLVYISRGENKAGFRKMPVAEKVYVKQGKEKESFWVK